MRLGLWDTVGGALPLSFACSFGWWLVEFQGEFFLMNFELLTFPCREIIKLSIHRVTWGKAPPFGDDLSLTYLFASTSEKSYM